MFLKISRSSVTEKRPSATIHKASATKTGRFREILKAREFSTITIIQSSVFPKIKEINLSAKSTLS